MNVETWPLSRIHASGMIGRIFGKLRVESFAHARNARSYWNCSCSCGGHKTAEGKGLRSGNITTCGCGRIERAATMGRRNIRHGCSRHSAGLKPSPEWNSWCAMKKRCLNKNHEAFERYAGRGIVICARWLNSFDNFRADMGPRPRGTTLERIDNNGSYEPGNCEWATPKKQAANTRSNIMLTINGVTKALPLWAEESPVSSGCIKQRVYAGWPHQAAVFTRSRLDAH